MTRVLQDKEERRVRKMSKYTTEVRYICETDAGLKESKGYDSVNEIIANSRTKIFNFDYPIFDSNYKSILETKILKHYYTREIGFETVGLWKLKLDTKMNEIMPFYNQLYKSTLLEFNPLWTEEYQTLHNKKNDGTNVNNSLATGSTNVSETSVNSTVNKEKLDQTRDNTNVTSDLRKDTNVSRDKYSDTPQGALTGVENDTYLTNARKITEDNKTEDDRTSINEDKLTGNNENTSDSSNVKSGDNTFNNANDSINVYNNLEDYLEVASGRRGKDASELLMNYRKTFLNIDMQIIDELEELFLHLW